MNEDSSGSLVKSGSAEKTRLLMLIAFLVIIVAGINFTNFSTSLAPLRIKSINTQKCWGVLPAYYVLPCYLRPWALACLLSFVLCLSFGD